MTTTATPPEAGDRVLSTLNRDGSRRWLYPRVSPGRFLRWRRVVAYALILIFTVLPWLDVGGKQAVLLDIPARRFTLFGTTFLPTDTLLLMLLLVAIFVAVFLVTALFGRLWCGWACPQTVYMEFLYRPIERLFDGSPDARRRGGRGATGVRKVLKYVVFGIVSLYLAHTFLAYFVPVEELFQWVRRSPAEHPTAFIVMAVTTGLMMFDFAFFREQTCIVACPYGRLQSVMLDRRSLIIGYDRARGEPRGRMRRARRGEDVPPPRLGDCVDCGLCVVTCPTGIDIRDGLQMECVGCAQCIDACDAVMDRIKRPRGLIRYSSQEALETGRARLLRPRVVIYPAILAVVLVAFGAALAGRAPAYVSLLRIGAAPYRTLESGEIANDLQVKIINRAPAVRSYRLDLLDLQGARIVGPDPVMTLDPGGSGSAEVAIVAPRDVFRRGQAEVRVAVHDGVEPAATRVYRLQGPFGGGRRAADDDGEDRP